MKKSVAALSVFWMAVGASATSFAAGQNFESTPAPVRLHESRNLLHAPEEEQSLNFTMAFACHEAMKFDDMVGKDVWQAFRVSPEMATQYAGGSVTSVNITSGRNTDPLTHGNNGITRVTVYLMEDFDKDPFYSQQGQLTHDPFYENFITLDTPYTIEAGKGFVVAYKCMPLSATDYYIAVDGMPRTDSDGCYVGRMGSDGKIEWVNYASEIGNLNMGMTILSDNLPKDAAGIFRIDPPQVAHPDEAFDFDIYAVGGAVNPVEALEIEYTVGGGEAVSYAFDLGEQPIPYGEYRVLTVKDAKCGIVGAALPLSVKITKVNGNPNTSLDPSAEAELLCMDPNRGYKRNILVEEGTGTWCTWCPAGIVLLEKIEDEWPGDFVCVAVHARDAMTVSSADPVLSYFPGLPAILIDRTLMVMPTDPEAYAEIRDYHDLVAKAPAVAEISEIHATIDGKELEAEAVISFAAPTVNEDRFGVAFYITENNVGPYMQTNGYAGGSNGAMGGWEYKDSPTPTMYDDVARYYVGDLTGTIGLLPADIEVDKKYSCTEVLSLENVAKEDFYITAFIIDNLNGTVVNSLRVSSSEASSVERIEGGRQSEVIGSKGMICVRGEFGSALIHTLDGRRVGSLKSEGMITLPTGIYIVTIDGKASKVIVG